MSIRLWGAVHCLIADTAEVQSLNHLPVRLARILYLAASLPEKLLEHLPLNLLAYLWPKKRKPTAPTVGLVIFNHLHQCYFKTSRKQSALGLF